MTIEQAKKNSASFLYLWASDEFLAAIPNKYARIIRTKRANQNRLITASFGEKNRDARIQEIRAQFIEDYGMTPAQALVVLAQGGTVAGKDWSKGVFGIGAVKRKDFAQDTDFSVDPTTGHILYKGQDVHNNTEEFSVDVVYGKSDTGETVITEYVVNDKMYERSFSSRLSDDGKFYAYQYNNSKGELMDADGKTASAKDSADIWGNINLTLNAILEWLLKFFGLDDNKTQTVTASNTLPSQKGDGFVTSTGFGDAGVVVLALAAGGAFLAGGFKGLKKSKKSK